MNLYIHVCVYISVLQVHKPSQMHFLARELDPSFWTMCSVLELKLGLLTAGTMGLASITVSTLMMLGFDVEDVSW